MEATERHVREQSASGALGTVEVPFVEELDVHVFTTNFMSPNRPVLMGPTSLGVDRWRAVREWVDSTSRGPHYERLCELFGECRVSVMDSGGSSCRDSTVREFLSVMQSGNTRLNGEDDGGSADKDLPYLKDW
jgi:hypothetical protein